MLAGIGLTIIVKQLPDAFGFLKPTESVGMEDGEQGIATSGISHWLDHIEPGAIIIALIGVVLLFAWSSKYFKKVQFLPAGLVVVLLGVVINQILRASGSELALHDGYLVQLPVPTDVNDFLSQFKTPDWSGFTNPVVWQTGVVIAVVASIETLLCIEATDKLDPLKRYTSGNAELRAQGIGNMVSGLIGGLPITSVIVRSSANINAGARTKLSTITHGVLLAVCVATIPFLLNMIPKAALAAILLYTGYRLCRPAVFKHMWHAGLPQFIPFVVTAIAVALPMLGLLKGVGIGMVISIIFLLRNNMKIPYYYHRSKYSNGEVIKLDLAQEVSFLNKGSIKSTLEKIPENSIIILDATNTEYIDFDVLEIIKEFQHRQAVDKNIKMSLIGFKNTYKIPSPVDSSHIEGLIVDQHPENKTSGNHKKLLKQLDNDR
jgi:MFS superfamily sulfate permease-like transporter